MAQASKTFRIFVSSTFSDLKAERNALQKHVFPKLRELCMQHGYRFQAIDLRWGVSTEAGLDQQTMNICLQELERCKSITPRPNFIVLLGDRYGWRPLPAQIEAKEFEAILDKVPQENEESLLWQEQQPNNRKGWYRKDENAEPAEYCLRPREVNVLDNASDEERKAALASEAEEWGEVEKRLGAGMLQAINKLGWLDNDPRRVKYEASATHQEIIRGALDVPDAHEHVYCFFRKIENIDDLLKDLLKAPDLLEAPKAKDFVDLDDSGHLDEKVQNQLESLKEELLRRRLPDNIFEYRAKWTGSGVTTEHIGDLPENMEDALRQWDPRKGLRKLCMDVYACLSKVILQQIEQMPEPGALDAEITAHDNFGQERARFFTGRVSILQSIGDYLKGTDNHPLAIFGESGSGKTALMARAAQRARETHPDAEVVSRLIGATPSSSDGRSLLESLCRQISRCYGADQSTIPTEYQKLVQEFPERLALATKEKPLILFLDALDQLSDIDNARNLAWLPVDLPENVHLVVSCLRGECLSALKSKLPMDNLKKLEPMPLSEGQELLSLWLGDAGRKLQSHQRDEVLGKFEQCRLPLYLKLAFEEARRWKSYTEKVELSPDTPGIIRDLFGRLSSDANHGKMIVSRSLGYLAAAKNGLTEDELLDVLSRDNDVIADFQRRSPKSPPVDKLPVVIWSRLFFDLEPYLTERTADGTSLMTFYHPTTFGQAVMAEYLTGDMKRERYRFLAQYFDSQELYIGRDEEKVPNLRKVSELPWQLAQGKSWQQLYATMADLPFFDAAWRVNQFEVQAYWTQIEGNSSLCMKDAYSPVIDAPAQGHRSAWNVAELLANAGHISEALTLRKYFVDLYRRKQDYQGLQAALTAMALLHKDLGELDNAIRLLEEQEFICRNMGYKEWLSRSLVVHAMILYDRGYMDGAMQLLREHESICRELNDKAGQRYSLSNQANILFVQGDLDGAMELYKELEAGYRSDGDRRNLGICLGNQAGILNMRGDEDGAVKLYRQQEQICRGIGYMAGLVGCLNSLASLHSYHYPEESVKLLSEAERICRDTGYKRMLAVTLGNQAELILQARGDLAKAIQLVQEEERIFRKLGDKMGLSDSLGRQAIILTMRQDLAGAIAVLKQQENICRELNYKKGLATSLADQAVVLALRGSLNEALHAGEEAVELAEKYGLSGTAQKARDAINFVREELSKL